MKRISGIRRLLGSLSVCGMVIFAFWMLISSGQLNAAVLRSINGPLDAQQLASIQLCNLLNVSAGAIICGGVFAGIWILATGGDKNQKCCT
jgi:hypothetical protein